MELEELNPKDLICIIEDLEFQLDHCRMRVVELEMEKMQLVSSIEQLLIDEKVK